MTVARSLAWVAFAWAIFSMFVCLYVGIASDWPFLAACGPIGLALVGFLVWTVFRRWFLVSFPLAAVLIPLSAVGLNPAFIFSASFLAIIVASWIDFLSPHDSRIGVAKGSQT